MLNRENTINLLKDNNIIKYSNIQFQELPFVKKINLRGDPSNKEFMSLNSKILNSDLPVEPNTYTNNQDLKIIWLGPNEWLIIEESQANEKDLISKLQNINNNQATSITDVSENRTIIRMSGKKLFTLFAKFLVLDLDSSFVKVKSVAQTLFVKVPVLLVRINSDAEEPKIDIFVNRSQANYIFNLLVDGTKNLFL